MTGMGEVYFVADTDRIKVGYSRRADKRIASINAYLTRPLTVLGIIEGDISIERAIQRRLAPYKLKGEWFRNCPEVREVIDGILMRGLAAMEIFAEEPSPKKVFVPGPIAPHALQKVARLMWGDDAEAEMAAMAEVPDDVARAWMDTTVEIPQVVRLAFCGALMMWMGGTLRSFVKERNSAE